MLKSLEALVNLNSGLISQATEFSGSKSWGERSATLSKYEDTADSVAQVIRNPKAHLPLATRFIEVSR
ncbi:hypothetical protein CDAR_308211 [Caerostris darwini]|uniref:Uncharacterized protein n=1 Tax=Caerostris darwini TaxID=1538125 RepID=A0AAV4SAP9_9ARAC|nr:hypothetical protein CDAR_308211 [Caerostris darwini]